MRYLLLNKRPKTTATSWDTKSVALSRIVTQQWRGPEAAAQAHIHNRHRDHRRRHIYKKAFLSVCFQSLLYSTQWGRLIEIEKAADFLQTHTKHFLSPRVSGFVIVVLVRALIHVKFVAHSAEIDSGLVRIPWFRHFLIIVVDWGNRVLVVVMVILNCLFFTLSCVCVDFFFWC